MITVYLWRNMMGGFLTSRDVEDHEVQFYNVELKTMDCPLCGKSHDGYYQTDYIGDCYDCSVRALLDRNPSPDKKTIIADSIMVGVHKGYRQQDVDKHKKDLIQPYREGEFSKEFAEAYPEQTQAMVRDGVITDKQVKKARNVWR